MVQKIKKINQDDITPEYLTELKGRDFFSGIWDPTERKIAKDNGLLKWTLKYEKERTHAFSTAMVISNYHKSF
jgi:hypothetical protein